MSEKKARPKSWHAYGREFIQAAEELEFDLTDARRVWRQVIRHLKSDPKRSTDDALADYATYGQLKRLYDAHPRPVKGLNDELWELFKKVAEKFVVEL